MSLYAIDEDIEELMGVDEESIEARNAKEAIAYEEGFSTDDVTLDEDIYWDELLDKLDGMSASEKAAVWSNYLAYQERSTTKIKPDKRTKEYREGTVEEAADTKETGSDADFDLGDKRVFDENAELSDEAYNRAWLGTTDQSYMLAQTWYLSGSYLTDSQRRGYQFLLDKEQREEVNYIYRTIFPNYFVEMVSTDEWWYAETIDEKLAMLKEVRDSSAAEARAIAQQRLRDAGVQSVPKQ